MIIISKRWSKKETKKVVDQINQWFKERPDRKDCKTDDEFIGMVERGNVKEQIVERIGTDY